MMKRIICLVILIASISSAMERSSSHLTPRTDDAAIVHKLQMLIRTHDAAYLQKSLEIVKKRLIESGKSIYNGRNDVCIEFLPSERVKIYQKNIGKTDCSQETFDFTIDQFQSYLNKVVDKTKGND